MIVSSPLFEAYLKCPTKCWLRSRGEPTTGNAYAEWACAQNVAYYEDRLKCLLAVFPESDRTIAPPISKHPKDSTWRLAVAVFAGDTLFMPDYGTARCDFPGGDARALYRSIQRLLELPPQTRLFMCHVCPGRARLRLRDDRRKIEPLQRAQSLTAQSAAR